MGKQTKGRGQGRSALNAKNIQQRKATDLAIKMRATGHKPGEILDAIQSRDWGEWTPWTSFPGMYVAMRKAITDIPMESARELRAQIDEVYLGIIKKHWDKADDSESANVVLRANTGRMKLYNLENHIFEDGGNYSLVVLVPNGFELVQLKPEKESE